VFKGITQQIGPKKKKKESPDLLSFLTTKRKKYSPSPAAAAIKPRPIGRFDEGNKKKRFLAHRGPYGLALHFMEGLKKRKKKRVCLRIF